MYVSARYAPPNVDPLMEPKPGEPRRVIATDTEGTEWFLTEDSQVGDWLRYIEANGKIDPPPLAKPAEPA
jgi:hypothetical protein